LHDDEDTISKKESKKKKLCKKKDLKNEKKMDKKIVPFKFQKV
jgi:hypothetical protein